MGTEYECRKLEVDVEKVIARCRKLGANFIGEYWQKRLVYDFKPVQKGRWIRLRENGNKATLTIKEIESLKISGTKEIEIEVSDFEKTREILKELDYLPRTYQENFRIEYLLNGVYIDIDKWPGIPCYVEVEGKDEKSVLETIELLEFVFEDFTTWDVDTVYFKCYGIRLDDIKELRFSESEIKEIESYKKYRRI